MAKLPLRIEVVRSNLKKLSSMSEVSAQAIVATLKKHYTDVVMINIDTSADLDALLERAPDLAFLGLPSVPSDSSPVDDLWISDKLETHGITHTGSTKTAHRLGVNKHLAKLQVMESGLQTSPFSIARIKDRAIVDDNSYVYPLFVKPSNKSGGFGVDKYSVVHNLKQLQSKITMVHELQHTDALVEQYLTGREFTVSVIFNKETGKLVAMPLEIIPTKDSNGDRMLSLEVKSSDVEEVIDVTDLNDRSKLIDFAVSVFKSLGARDYGRIDIRYDKDEIPHFLEANLIPSLIEDYGSFPRAYISNLGLTHEDMLLHLVQLALERSPKELLVPQPLA